MKATLLALLASGLLASPLWAQTQPTANWAGRAGNNNLPDVGLDVTTDQRGNLLVAGEITGTTDIGGMQLPGLASRTDAFVAQYAPNGTANWAVRLVSIGRSSATAVTTDAAGCSYVTGSFSGTMQLGGTTLQSVGQQDIFVVKLTPAGRVRWARQAGGAAPNESGLDICSGPNAELTVGGRIGSGGRIGTAAPAISGSQDLFVAHYDSAGTLLWVRTAGGSAPTGTVDQDAAAALGADAAGNVYVTGTFNGSATFGGMSVSTSATTAHNIYLTKYDRNGTVQWVRTGSGTASSRGLGIWVTATGTCAITGELSGTVTFGTQVMTYPSPWPRAFVARYAADGSLGWVRQLSGFSSTGRDVALDAAGNSYLTGEFFQNMNVAGQTVRPINGQFMFSDMYLVRFDAQGTANWVMRGGGENDDVSHGLTVDAQGTCYATGAFQLSADFGSQRLSTVSDTDIFLVRLGSAAPTATVASREVQAQVAVYPNPASGELRLSWPAAWAGAGQVRLRNALGQQVWQQRVTAAAATVDVSRFAPGIYLLTADTPRGRVTRRVTIQNQP